MERDSLMWLVGVVESEGCIDAQAGKYPRVRVAMSDRDTVGRVATLFGSSLRASARPGRKAMYHAEIQGPRAEALIREILPYLGARRSSKAIEVLSAYAESQGKSLGAVGLDFRRPPGTFPVAV
jgi:hypothetical protein